MAGDKEKLTRRNRIGRAVNEGFAKFGASDSVLSQVA